MNAGLKVCSAALAVFCVSAAPATAFDTRSSGPPPEWAGPGAAYDFGPGFALLRPWYLDPQYGTRRFYRKRDPYQYPMPVYIEPNYRFSGGYPHSYPLTGYIYPYPQRRYIPPPPPPAPEPPMVLEPPRGLPPLK